MGFGWHERLDPLDSTPRTGPVRALNGSSFTDSATYKTKAETETLVDNAKEAASNATEGLLHNRAIAPPLPFHDWIARMSAPFAPRNSTRSERRRHVR